MAKIPTVLGASVACACLLRFAPAEAVTIDVSLSENFVDQFGVNPIQIGTEIGNSIYYTGTTFDTVGAVSVTPSPGSTPPSSSTTVTATQGSARLNIPYLGPPGSAFPNQFVRNIPFNPILTGSWTLTVSNPSASISPVTAVTPALTVTTPPPPVFNIVVSGDGMAPTVSWSIPPGSSATNQTVFIFNALSPGAPAQGAAFASPVLPSNQNSYTIPTNVLKPGQLYTISVQSDILNNNPAPGQAAEEARSRTFTAALVPQAGTITTPLVIPTVSPTPSAFGGPVYSFNSPVTAGTPITIDPLAVIGFIFQTGATDPNFASVELPNIGNPNPYSLYLWNGSSFVFDTTLDANTVFDFAPGGVNEFEVLGIDPDLGLDPNSATDFATTLTFVANGEFTGTMTPIQNTPIPAALPLFATGLGALGLLSWRRKRKARVSLLGAD